MQRILITGGAGFVGSSIAVGLRAHSPALQVVALDNLKRRGSELILERLRKGGVEFVHGDIRSYDDIAAAGKADLVIECSAEPSVLAGYGESPRYLLDTNLAGTLNCLEFARAQRAGVIFLSTSRVYPVAPLNALRLREDATRFALADEQTVPGVSAKGIAEDFPLAGCRSLYGTTKLCSELVLQEYIEMYGLRGVINRCGILTGPWQMGKVDQGVVVLWMARHVYGGALAYIGYGGQGKQVRDLLHVDDLVALVLHEMEHLDALSGGIYNVGGGLESSLSLCELTALCRDITGNPIPIGADPKDRPADIPLYLSDTSAVRAATGWQPKKTTAETLQDIHRWIEDNKEPLRSVLA